MQGCFRHLAVVIIAWAAIEIEVRASCGVHLGRNHSLHDAADGVAHSSSGGASGCIVALGDVGGVVVAEHDFASGIAPHQGFEGQVDSCGLGALHQQRAACGVAEDEELGGAEGFADTGCACRVIDASNDTKAFFFHAGFKPVHRFFG